MENIMKKLFRSSIMMSFVLMILGVLLIFYSEATIISISYIIGAILIAIGVLAILKYIKKSNNLQKESLDIVYGIIAIILGIVVITHPTSIASFIPLVIGIGIIINSATKLQYAIELRKKGNKIWKSTMIISIISTICGVILLFNPFKGAVILTKIIGVLILLYSILDIVSTLSIRKNVVRIHSAIEESITDAEIIEEETKDKKVKNKRKNKKNKNKNE